LADIGRTDPNTIFTDFDLSLSAINLEPNWLSERTETTSFTVFK